MALAGLVRPHRLSRTNDSLYADMGGQPGIDKIVDASVDNYLADDRIKAIFDESNMDRIRMELEGPILPSCRRPLHL